jgi:hypothetical protein
LAALPRPPQFNPTWPGGKPMKIDWPPNLNVLDGFLTCFDRTYSEAYGNKMCTRPIGQIQLPRG